MTVKVPTASEANFVEAGATLSWNNVVAYSAALTDDGAQDMVAKHSITDPFTPLGVHVFNARKRKNKWNSYKMGRIVGVENDRYYIVRFSCVRKTWIRKNWIFFDI
ncbi:hypothetical protein [Peribacillus simplex]|uniref:hypothetical protein n=1 Tax=Peribacillus simplex TaxID=1478 RepID=UPI0024C177EA|nr:hypothetical protein [Peribacillus simplex]WHY99443.1 hypothetical protein QNH37_09980 [Peribacillus simplex]